MTGSQRWSVVIGTSLVLWGISERIFWSLMRPDDIWYFILLGILPYVVAVYIVLLAIEYFKVSTVGGLLLVGALFGWIAEGIVAMTVFGAGGIPFPISLSWTGLAWHMLLSVGVFLWWHRRVMSRSFFSSLLFSVLIGLGWGLWCMTWFFETPPIINTLPQFALHAFGVTALMIIGHMLLNRQISTFVTPKIERGVMLALVLAFFALITVPAVWFAIIVIPLLGLIIYIPLRRNRPRYAAAMVLEKLTERVPLINILTMFLAPTVATLMYAFFLENPEVLFPINFAVLGITTFLGCVIFGWAWVNVWRAPKTIKHPTASHGVWPERGR